MFVIPLFRLAIAHSELVEHLERVIAKAQDIRDAGLSAEREWLAEGA